VLVMIVNFTGGLGNQLFVAAFGFSVAKARNEEVFFDKTPYQRETLRHYVLDAYDLPIKFHEGFHRGPWYTEKSAFFDPKVYEQPPGSGFSGYWQNEKYFDKELVSNLFRKPAGYPNDACLRMARKIQQSDSCFIGVRRADYLWPERINYHGVMPMEYYRWAFGCVPYQSNMFVFTDDIPWAKENFPCFEIVDVNGPDEKHWDIWLMSLCKHAIIANSTFHWWGSFLGPDRNGGTIIAPKRWFADEKVNEQCEIVPERWIRI
jgi:hypothetical protein